MICGSCKLPKTDDEFTNLNISKDGSKGLCKDCKRLRDAEHHAKVKKANAELPYFNLVPDLLKRKKARIGVLELTKFTDRGNTKHKSSLNMLNMGLNAILKELDGPYEYCDARSMNNYEFILVSLTSVMDVENLIYTFEVFAPKIIKPKVIIGGFGVININLIKPYIDVACFGRSEGQINSIIAGERFNNVWRKRDDPDLIGKYVIRQPQYLLKGEVSVGCRNNCMFCQYTHVRYQLTKNTVYNHGGGSHLVESEWATLEIDSPGRFTTAWDGWSEQTRLRVKKPITDDAIIKKLIDFGNRDIGAGINLKVFQIVGYPWETPKSVLQDIDDTKELLSYVDRKIKNRIVLTFLNTPFGPEPMTPMQYDRANIDVMWGNVLNFKDVYVGEHLKAIIMPNISGAFTLMKRVFIHRATADKLDTFKRIIFNGRLRRMEDETKMAWLFKYGYIDRSMFGEVESAPFDYLKAETDRRC